MRRPRIGEPRTVGFGDIRAHNSPEMFVSIGVELTGGVAFGLLCGTLSNVIMSTVRRQRRAPPPALSCDWLGWDEVPSRDPRHRRRRRHVLRS